MKNKKSQSQIITIVLIILLVLSAIVIVWQVVMGTDYEPELFREEACRNLYYEDEKGFMVLYPPFVKLIDDVEKELNMSVDSHRTKGKWAGCSGLDGCQNIDCRIHATMCHPSRYESGYCVDVDLNLIIDYEKWKEWWETNK